jgi:hypothetical protein
MRTLKPGSAMGANACAFFLLDGSQHQRQRGECVEPIRRANVQTRQHAKWQSVT